MWGYGLCLAIYEFLTLALNPTGGVTVTVASSIKSGASRPLYPQETRHGHDEQNAILRVVQIVLCMRVGHRSGRMYVKVGN